MGHTKQILLLWCCLLLRKLSCDSWSETHFSMKKPSFVDLKKETVELRLKEGITKRNQREREKERQRGRDGGRKRDGERSGTETVALLNGWALIKHLLHFTAVLQYSLPWTSLGPYYVLTNLCSVLLEITWPRPTGSLNQYCPSSAGPTHRVG